MKYKICLAFYLETRDWCEFSARNNTTTHRRSTISEKHRLVFFINQLTNSSTLRPLQCGACCKTHLITHLHERILLPWSVPASFIYKLGMLTGQRFQAELSPSFFWKFTEFRAQTPPSCLRNSKLRYPLPPTRLRNSSPRNPPLPRNSKMPPVVWYGYFLESPNKME